MRLIPKKAKSTVVRRSRISAPGHGDLTLGGAEVKQVKSLRILGEILDFKLTFETHLREVATKAAMSYVIVTRAGKLFDCPRVLKGCFNANVFF